jgi:Right handed beta helix region
MALPRPVLLAALALVLVLAGVPAAHAATYVDRGSVGGACSDARTAAQASSPATPWCTLDAAFTKTPSGATLYVRRGDYPWRSIRATSRATDWVTVRPHPGETPTVSFELRGFSRMRFEGLSFSASGAVVYSGNEHIRFVGNDLRGAVNVTGETSRDVLFEGNRFHDGPDACQVDSSQAGGVRAHNTDGLVIRDNVFERLTGDAIQIAANDVLIEGNTFDHIAVAPGCGAHTDVIQSLGAENVTIRGNVARDNDSGILNSSATRQVHGWTIENNVFVRSSGTPLQLDNQMDDLVVVNNTFADSGVGVLFRWWSNASVPVNSQGFVIANNIFDDGYSIDPRLNVALADFNLVPAGASRLGPHDVAAGPRFASDYGLRADSPAVDSGLAGALGSVRGATVLAPTLDGAGRARDGALDRGALELGGTATTTPTPTPTPAPDTAEEPAPPDPVIEPAPAAPAAPPATATPATARPPRLSRVLVPALLVRRGRAARPVVRFTLDRAARVTIAVTAARRGVARTTVRARAGANRVALAVSSLRPGRYRVRVSVASGAAVSGTLRVRS